MLVIVMDLAYAQAAIEVGVDDFLVVPINPIEGLLRVRKLTRATNVVRVGDLEIDLAACRVSSRGYRVRLSSLWKESVPETAASNLMFYYDIEA